MNVEGVNAALTYVSATQIYFQVPWETAPSTSVNVKVTRNHIDSNVEPVRAIATGRIVWTTSLLVNDSAMYELTGGVAVLAGLARFAPAPAVPVTVRSLVRAVLPRAPALPAAAEVVADD